MTVNFSVKLILANLILALFLLLFSPTLCVEAANSSAVWHVDSLTNKSLYYHDYSTNRSTATLNLDIKTQLSTYLISDIIDIGGQLTVSYEPFTYSLDLGTRFSGSTVYTSRGSSLLKNIQPYIVDNLDNEYPLDPVNGGSFIIEDTSNITSLSLYLLGPVSGTITNNGTTFRYVQITANISSFDISFSLADKSRTITDSEGTVWTVPDNVDNPVVISAGNEWKYLFDASNLKYITRDDDSYVLVSENIETVQLYNRQGSLYTSFTLDILNQNYNIPFYLTSLSFDSFLYGSLPELILESIPITPPDPDDTFEQLDVVMSEIESDINPNDFIVIYDAKDNQPQNNWYTTWQSTGRSFSVFSSRRTLETVDGNDYFYHAHFDEYVSYPLTVFNGPAAPYDGYCVVSFPQGYGFKESGDGYEFPNGGKDIASAHFIVEIIPYMLVQGVRYEISPFGCQFTFPVYEGESFSYLIGYEAHIRADVQGTAPTQVQFEFLYDIYDYTVSTWYYTDGDELSQILDLLEHSDKSDGLEAANDSLGNVFGDYNNVEKEGIAGAVDNINSFDFENTFTFSGGLLSALQFWLPVMTNVIAAMGDFAVLYTIGITLAFLMIIVGAVRYAIAQEADRHSRATNSQKSNSNKGSKSSSKKGGG